jgi:uncharacterized protein
MPVITSSTYQPQRILRHAHLNTVISAVFRRTPKISYQRERVELLDGDFIDVDWLREDGRKALVILLHGMEGNSQRPYIKGMANTFDKAGYDVAVMHFRGCSGSPNRLPRAYHIGDTADLKYLVERIITTRQYSGISLIGFSLGGNVILKYLGEQGTLIPEIIRKAVVFSVPCDIAGAEQEIARRQNRLYVWRFLSTLNAKMREKAVRFPEIIRADKPMPRTLRSFDDRFTAPLHGFTGAFDYWSNSASLSYISDIRLPTLMINALDDSFLSPGCYPFEAAEKSSYVNLETPEWGGHVGFAIFGQRLYWSELRALEFILNGR